jgi:flagellar hook assembly protein FlgD
MEPTALGSESIAAVPASFSLRQNYPNPFNPSTTIEFGIQSQSRVTLRIFNVLGQQVAELTDARYEPGIYKMHWNGKNQSGAQVSSGVYIYQLDAKTRSGEHKTFIKKMILLR